MARNSPGIRTFLALPLAPIFLEEISPFLKEIKNKIDGVKWVLPEQVHITLHFFGATTETEVDKIKMIVIPIAAEFLPLRLALEDVGTFPHSHSPRIIWIGLAGETEFLTRLQKEIEEKLGSAGFLLEDRPFRPHATIGRVKDGKGFRTNSDFDSILFPKSKSKVIDHIVLYQSHLSSEGPSYEILESFHLSKKPRS